MHCGHQRPPETWGLISSWLGSTSHETERKRVAFCRMNGIRLMSVSYFMAPSPQPCKVANCIGALTKHIIAALGRRWIFQGSSEDDVWVLNSAKRLISSPLKGIFSTAMPGSTHYQTLLSVLFKQPFSQASQTRNLLYDLEADVPEHANLSTIVEDRLKAIFHLHRAIDMKLPLLVPLMNLEENEPWATFIDRHRKVTYLPNQALIPFARLAARNGVKCIKCFHNMNTYHPKYFNSYLWRTSHIDTPIPWCHSGTPQDSESCHFRYHHPGHKKWHDCSRGRADTASQRLSP